MGVPEGMDLDPNYNFVDPYTEDLVGEDENIHDSSYYQVFTAVMQNRLSSFHLCFCVAGFGVELARPNAMRADHVAIAETTVSTVSTK
jgi:hypothetical protein